jgi:hypothetical protein
MGDQWMPLQALFASVPAAHTEAGKHTLKHKHQHAGSMDGVE